MNLSQDEINAMLGGAPAEPSGDSDGGVMDAAAIEAAFAAAGEPDGAAPEETEAASNEPMDQAAIEALLNSAGATEEAAQEPPSDSPAQDDFGGQTDEEIEAEIRRAQYQPDGSIKRDGYELSALEVDALGELGNMCMGAVATTMYTLLDRRVDITTPKVSIHTTQEVLSMYKVPFVVVEVEYVQGIEGKNLLLLKEPDAALITDLLLGGDGHIEEPVELNELHMSAISEIMNQMIGASATALSKIISGPVDISTPISHRVDLSTDVSEMLDTSQMVIKVSFDMVIEGLLESQLLQLMPFDVGHKLVKTMIGEEDITEADMIAATTPAPAPAAPAPAPAPAAPAAAAAAAAPAPAPMYAPDPYGQQGQTPPPQYAAPPGYGYPPPGYGYPPPGYGAPAPVNVQPMQFQSFDPAPAEQAPVHGMGLIHDIPLQVSVQLGQTKKQISDILDFGVGTVVVLDKLAGEPVEILINGKLIARGEVVVIDENYGVRITDLIS